MPKERRFWLLTILLITVLPMPVPAQQVLPPTPNTAGFPTCQLANTNGVRPFISPVAVSRTEWKNPPKDLSDATVLASIGQATLGQVSAGSIGMMRGLSTGSSVLGWAFTALTVRGMFKTQTHVFPGLIPGRTAGAVASSLPKFELSYGDVPGWNPDDYEPVIIKLVATKDNYRAVGAMTLKEEHKVVKNKLTVSLVEDRVPIQTHLLGRGHVIIEPETPLAAGEYGVVLRPHWKSKEGTKGEWESSDLASLPDYVWSFTVN